VTGVVVLGMHRSGTSATTRMVSLLGVPTCRADDLVRDRTGNARGHWESGSLVVFNDELLREASSAWWCPPPEGWDWADVATAERLERARAAFYGAHATEQWVWKDPRTCLTLPFWLAALRRPPAVVLVHRNPLEIAASLGARSGLSTRATLALWERYVRTALAAAEGLPVFVSGFDETLRDPEGWSRDVAGFLAAAGIDASARDGGTSGFASPTLRHSERSPEELAADPEVSPEQRLLAETLDGLRGPHRSFCAPRLPDETPTTEAFFAEQRAARGLAPGRAAARPSGIHFYAPRNGNDGRLAPATTVSVVLVHRDGGTDRLARTVDRLAATLPESTQIAVEDGRGDVVGARNAGAERVDGEIVVFCDPWVEPEPDWFPALRDALGRSDVGAVGPALLASDHVVHGLTLAEPVLNVRWLRGDARRDPFAVPVLSGCFLAVRRETFDAVGRFDDGMTGQGGGDVELCFRLWRLGYACLSVPAARVRRDFAAAMAAPVDADAHLRNLLRLGLLHLSPPRLGRFVTALAAHPAFPETLAEVLAGDVGRRRAFVDALACFDDAWFLDRFEIRAFD
jgi:glycosyl transferase family 2